MKRVVCVMAALIPLVFLGGRADAHPLGNFTVNQYTGLDISPRSVAVHHVVDMAEIPTFQTRGQIDTNGDGHVEHGESTRYAHAECGQMAHGLALSVSGVAMDLSLASSRLTFPSGAAGLRTLRLECNFAAVGVARGSIDVRNANFAGRIGWREITASGDGTRLVSSNVPARSVSEELTRYPTDLLSSPLDVRSAHVTFRPGAGTAGATDVRATPRFLPRGVDKSTQAFMALVSRRDLTLAFAFVALALAIVLGAIHALAPGHGKSVMAAYLVGQRGSVRQAAGIGLTVTLTHTTGVLVLGILLTTSTSVVPERLYPILGFASGAMLFGVGVGLLRRMRNRHEHGHTHSHDGHTHSHDAPVVSGRGLFAMGFAGGLVPSPSALVVLLGAIALHRAWFGVLLVVAYGVGMAATLTVAGLLLVRARSRLDRRERTGLRARVIAAVPVLSASVVCVVGLVLAIRAAIAI